MAKITFPVEASHIMMFARSIGDTNPVYYDAEAAKKTEAGGIIAPPSFAQSVAQFNPDYFLRPKPGQPWFGSGKTASGVEGKASSSGGLHAEQHFEFHRHIGPGDVLLGLASSGVHSNGFSLVRRVLAAAQLTLADPAPFAPGQSMAEALLTPTRIYVKPLLAAHRAGLVKAAAHITGGGLPGNLPRVLPARVLAALDARAFAVPPVFAWLAQAGGIAADEMLRVFNCGIGMVVVVAAAQAEAAEALLRAGGETVSRIGVLEATEGPAAVRVDHLGPRWPG